MKYLTMVARSGDPKGPSGLMNYTLVGSDFSISNMKGDNIAKGINEGKINVTNLSVSAQGLISTNGAIGKYTTFDVNGNLVGTPRAVILNRVETNGKLTAYIMFTNNGIIKQATVAEAAALAAQGLIANGKIRHTADGDIVSSITGNYPLLERQIKESEDDVVNVDIVFFGSAFKNGKTAQFGGVIVTSKSAKTIAKMFSKLNDANVKLRDTLHENFGYSDAELKSLEFKQAPGAGFYGVYPISVVDNLMKSGHVKCSIGKLMIGCLDKSEEGLNESIAIVDIKKKAVIKSQEGTDSSDKILKTYVDKTLAKF